MITSNKIKLIREKLKNAIAKIEAEENVTIEFGSAKYNSAYFTSTMTVKTTEKCEKVSSIYETTCKMLGFTQNVIGMEFIGKNGIYKITDIATKNRKYPVIAVGPDGRAYKYGVDHIKILIGGNKIINRNSNLSKLIPD